MSKKFSGRIHDPNNELSDYDIYFNDTLVTGTGVYSAAEIADIFGSATVTGASPLTVTDSAPMSPVKLEAAGPKENVLLVIKNKNDLVLKQYSGSETRNGITLTYNEDGSVTANGTATAIADFYISELTDDYTGKSMTLTGCPSGGGSNTYRLSFAEGSTSYGNDDGSGFTYANCKANTRFRLRIASGYTANNLTFYPMVRLSSITDAAFQKAEKQVYNFRTAGESPIDLLSYASAELYDGYTMIETDAGNISMEYIQKGA